MADADFPVVWRLIGYSVFKEFRDYNMPRRVRRMWQDMPYNERKQCLEKFAAFHAENRLDDFWNEMKAEAVVAYVASRGPDAAVTAQVAEWRASRSPAGASAFDAAVAARGLAAAGTAAATLPGGL